MCTINVHAIYALLQTPYKLICCTTLLTRLSLSSNKLQSLSSNLFLFFFLTPPLWYYALHFSRGQINWIHNSSICNFAHLYILNLIQVSSMQLKTSTTQVAQYDLYTAMHIEWHSVRRIMQNAQSCNTADSSIRQMHQYGRSTKYSRAINTTENSMPYTK